MKKAKISDLTFDDSEIWVDVIGYEGFYQVSNFGKVRSLDRLVNAKLGSKCTKKGVLMVPSELNRGYLQVRLSINGKGRWWRIHTLVAQAFIPNPNNYNQINHKNEISSDNHYSNLEWCTVKYNNNYGTRMAKIKKAMTNGKLSRPVIQKTKQGEFIKEWASMSEAQRQLGVSNSKISKACKDTKYTAGGFRWEKIAICQ